MTMSMPLNEDIRKRMPPSGKRKSAMDMMNVTVAVTAAWRPTMFSSLCLQTT